MTRKINYGCGQDYRDGWINIDIVDKWTSPEKKPDILLNEGHIKLPFEDNSIDYILMDNVIEHIDAKQITDILLEFHRILKPKGVLEIYCPHFKSIAVKYLEHTKCYGINSFWYFEKYFDIKQELFMISRNNNAGFTKLRFLNKLNFLFNGNQTWQQFCEKFFFGGFEEIHYIMRKKNQ